MTKKVVILQSNYIPWKGYFDLVQEADVFVFYDCVQYTKNDWRNRNQIYTKNGKQWLTIPIPSKATRYAIDEVEIKDKKWQQQHLKSLYLGYKNAPYFQQLEELMTDYLQEKTWTSLSALNRYLIEKISKNIGCKTVFRDAREFDMDADRVQRLLNILVSLEAKTYISGQAAKIYLTGEEQRLEDRGITLAFKSYPEYPTYSQLSEPFEQGVSIVDMIANLAWDDIKNYIWNLEV
ncbi:MAG: WbqC family protein [Bernardetiaceae bacterium]|nr:WbqC family protein [Bernardetiaceae bacterium]